MQRRRAVTPARVPRWPALVLLGAVALVFGAIVALHHPWLERAVALEGAPVAWLQSSMLWSAATLALLLAVIEPPRRRGWVAAACAFALAALDERFMGHERLKDWVLFSVFDGQVQAMGWWGDAPLAVAALAGALLLVWLVRGPTPLRVTPWLVAALAAGAAAVALDLAFDGLAWQTVEEGLELVAATLCVAALLQHAQRCRP